MKLPWRALLCAVLFVVSEPGPAGAREEVGLSADGITFAPTLSAPIFDPSLRWVPGDDETASFYVRNQGPSRAFMTIEVRSGDTDKLLSNDDISLRARAAGGAWVTLVNGASSDKLTQHGLARGGVDRVDLNVRFDPRSTNQSQVKGLGLTVDVTLSDARLGGGHEAGDDDDADGSRNEGGLLPDSGSPFAAWQLIGAGAMIVVGARLARRRMAVRHG